MFGLALDGPREFGAIPQEHPTGTRGSPSPGAPRPAYPHVPNPDPLLSSIQAFDVASGLAHLHSMKIVHGDLKGVSLAYNLQVLRTDNAENS